MANKKVWEVATQDSLQEFPASVAHVSSEEIRQLGPHSIMLAGGDSVEFDSPIIAIRQAELSNP